MPPPLLLLPATGLGLSASAGASADSASAGLEDIFCSVSWPISSSREHISATPPRLTICTAFRGSRPYLLTIHLG